MYPYQYPMYPFNPVCGGCSMPYSYPVEDAYRSSESEDFNFSQEPRGEAPANMQIPMPSMMTQPGTMMPGMMAPTGTMQPDMLTQLNTLQTDIMAQLNALQQSTFTNVLKQIQTETPQIISALIAIGTSIEALRQIILRIIEVANKEQKSAM